MGLMVRKTHDMPLLITTAIEATAPRTALVDRDERLRYTLDAVRRWVDVAVFRRIVICDGSGYELAAAVESCARANVAIETLHFRTDPNGLAARGKGFGEGQIVAHALAHSGFLKEAASFAKCTGKLWVTNAGACVRNYDGTASVNFAGGLVPRYIDTRFYLCSRSFYDSRLSACHESVDEARGQFLEHRFYEALKGRQMYRHAMFPTPVILGMSGSMGRTHGGSRLNNVVKDVRNLVLRSLGR